MDFIAKGPASRSLPQPVPDTQTTDARLGRYGDQYSVSLINNYYGVADEGAYFVVTNPTPGTGLTFSLNTATTAATADVLAGLVIQNADANPTSTVGKRIFLDYIKLICTAATVGASAAPFYQMYARIDSVLSRYTSGGTQYYPVNTNMDASNNSISKVFFGNLTTAALSSAGRLVWRQPIRGVTLAPAPNEVIIINFGSVEKAVGNQLINVAVASGPYQYVFNAPPVVLGPGHTFSLHGYTAATFTTQPSFEFEIGYYER